MYDVYEIRTVNGKQTRERCNSDVCPLNYYTAVALREYMEAEYPGAEYRIVAR